MKKNPQLLNEKVKQSVRGLGRPKPKREPRPIVRPIRPAVTWRQYLDQLADYDGISADKFCSELIYAAAKAAGIFGEGR